MSSRKKPHNRTHRKTFTEIPLSPKMPLIIAKIQDLCLKINVQRKTGNMHADGGIEDLLSEQRSVQKEALALFCEVFDCGVPRHLLPENCLVVGSDSKSHGHGYFNNQIGIDWSAADLESESVAEQIENKTIKFPLLDHWSIVYVVVRLENGLCAALPRGIVTHPRLGEEDIHQSDLEEATAFARAMGFVCVQHKDWSWWNAPSEGLNAQSTLILFEKQSSDEEIWHHFSKSLRKWVMEHSALLKSKKPSDLLWEGVIEMVKYEPFFPDEAKDFADFQARFEEVYMATLRDPSKKWHFRDKQRSWPAFSRQQVLECLEELFALWKNQD